MNHDPLCTEPSHVYGTASVCLTCFERRVRADEREKAAQRVEAVRLVTSRPDGFLIYLDEAVAAVRGES